MPTVTFADLVLHATDYVGMSTGTTDQRGIRDAAVSAMRALVASADWRYYKRSQLLHTNAVYTSLATAAYTHATRTVVWPVTLPTWFGPGCAVIAATNIAYIVEDVVVGSTTNFTLQPFANPGADATLAIGTVLGKYTYDLPDDFARVYRVGMVAAGWLALLPASGVEMADLLRRTYCVGTPRRFTIIGSTVRSGKMAIQLHPVPNVAQNIGVFYARNPRVLRISDSRAGTVTGTAGSATVTGAGTAFSQTMVGSVIRFTDTGDWPTGLGDTNPYTEERFVRAVTSATSLTVDAVLTYSYAAKKFVVSDPVDVPAYALTFLYRLVEREVRLLKRMDAKPEEQEALMQEQIRAMEGDNSYADLDYFGPSAGYPDLTPRYLYQANLAGG